MNSELVKSNAKKLVFFEKWVDPVAERILRQHSDIDLISLNYSESQTATWRHLTTAHGYQISPRGDLMEPWFGNAALLSRCPRLLAITSTGAGFDMVDVDACTKAGVIVCNQSGTNKEAVAEHTLGFMLALSKRIAVADKGMRRPGMVDRFSVTGNDIYGKTIGIVGIGQIGTRTAELCRTLMKMKILAYDPYLTAGEIAKRGGIKVEFAELLRDSDFVSVHCPRNAETMNMFDTSAFTAMKPTAYFINTARGGIHDEGALADALQRKLIAGAGVDVFLKEPPLPSHPLLAFDNVIASPHIAGITVEALHEMAKSAADQWLTIFDGKVPPRLVNPEAWPLYQQRFSELLGAQPSKIEA